MKKKLPTFQHVKMLPLSLSAPDSLSSSSLQVYYGDVYTRIKKRKKKKQNSEEAEKETMMIIVGGCYIVISSLSNQNPDS